MHRSIRPTWVTVIWLGLLLVLVAFAAAQTRLAQAPPTGMVAAFVDTNGNDIDDSCDDPATVAAEADPEAEASAEAAVDRDGDGTISVSEAAHSDRIGGKNCNHGGYVSWVAHGSCHDATPQEPVTGPVTGPALDAVRVTTEVCAEDSAQEAADEAAADDPTTECVGSPRPSAIRDRRAEERPRQVGLDGRAVWCGSAARAATTAVPSAKLPRRTTRLRGPHARPPGPNQLPPRPRRRPLARPPRPHAMPRSSPRSMARATRRTTDPTRHPDDGVAPHDAVIAYPPCVARTVGGASVTGDTAPGRMGPPSTDFRRDHGQARRLPPMATTLTAGMATRHRSLPRTTASFPPRRRRSVSVAEAVG